MEVEITSTVALECPHCHRKWDQEITLHDDIEIEPPERDEL